MWAKSEPTLNRLQEKFTNKLQKVSQHFQDKVNKKVNRWLHKGRRKQNSPKDSPGDNARSFKASSKRRQFRNRNKNEHPSIHPHEKKMTRKCNKVFNKIVEHIKDMSRREFKKLRATDMRNVLNQFEQFDSRFGTHVLMEASQTWFQCQNGWWTDMARGRTARVQQHCYIYMKRWQIKESKSAKLKQWKKVGWNFIKTPCIKHALDNSGNEDLPSQTDSVEEMYTFDHKLNGDQGKRVMSGQKGNTINVNVDDQSLASKAGNTRGDNPEVTDSDIGNSTENLVIDICNSKLEKEVDTKSTWYMNMFTGRQYVRNVKEDISYEGDHKADWLFERADDREFERERPDDWFFRRTDKHDPNKNSD